MSTFAYQGTIQGPPAPPDRGDWGGGGGVPGRFRRVSFTGIVVAMASVAMVFIAFTSAFAALRSSAEDWIRIPKPGLLWANTVVIVLSSLTLDRSRIALKRKNRTEFNLWWTLSLALGAGFLAGQGAVWIELRRMGLDFDTIPSGTFFYLLTAAHALHLVAGLLALAYVDVQAWRLRLGPAKRTAIDVSAVFWHFLTGIWLYLMLLFYVWG